MSASNDWPNGAPGSDEAVAAGCICARIDNSRGLGRGGARHGWYITHGCPVHMPGEGEKGR